MFRWALEEQKILSNQFSNKTFFEKQNVRFEHLSKSFFLWNNLIKKYPDIRTNLGTF